LSHLKVKQQTKVNLLCQFSVFTCQYFAAHTFSSQESSVMTFVESRKIFKWFHLQNGFPPVRHFLRIFLLSLHFCKIFKSHRKLVLFGPQKGNQSVSNGRLADDNFRTSGSSQMWKHCCSTITSSRAGWTSFQINYFFCATA